MSDLTDARIYIKRNCNSLNHGANKQMFTFFLQWNEKTIIIMQNLEQAAGSFKHEQKGRGLQHFQPIRVADSRDVTVLHNERASEQTHIDQCDSFPTRVAASSALTMLPKLLLS